MRKKLIITIGIFFIIALTAVIYTKYQDIFVPNLNLISSSNEFIYIPTGADYSKFLEIIDKSQVLIDFDAFLSTAKLKNLKQNINSGRYKLINNMNNNELINMFRSGRQSIVHLSFNNIRTKEQLAGIISNQIESDSVSILRLLKNEEALQSLDSDTQTIMAVFIPNTYEFYWNTSASKMLERMIKENKIFWNQSRLEKAKLLNLSYAEISTLASIIDEETEDSSEKPRIAGVYINRLKRGIALQADPSIKFALKDFKKKRITTKDLQVNSPYNTYLNRGLPPGPIRIASINAIDAVLNYEKHSYFYFCAKEDFSGSHVFAKSLRQHNQNAKRYHKALNRNRIYK